MNGCLFFTVILYLVHVRLSERSRPLLGPGFWRALQTSLRTRDFLLRKVIPSGAMEQHIKERLLAQVRRGTLRDVDLQELSEFYSQSRKQQEELKGLLGTYVMHLAFVLLVPLAFRLLLTSQLLCGRSDFLEILLACLGFMLIARILFKQWPLPSLARKGVLEDFIAAYMGEGDCGIWTEDVLRISRQSWLSGIDGNLERKTLLKEWHWAQAAAFQQRRVLLENCLGPLELLTSAYFALCLLLGPLLSHFSSLVPS